jgi:hypothetical protein
MKFKMSFWDKKRNAQTHKMELDIFEKAYNKYAEPDWDYVEPNDEYYDMIIKNRSAYIFREMVNDGEVQAFDIDAMASINATTRRFNQQNRYK